jgi:hypothetical protein
MNAHLFLKVGGGVVISVKANCIDSTAAPEAVFAREVQKMREERIKPLEQLTLGMLPCIMLYPRSQSLTIIQNPSREITPWFAVFTVPSKCKIQ